MPPTIYEISAFLFGLLIGSFLNVCISRLPKHESIVKPRSHCLNCLTAIRWYDNIPLLSWILLRGRCRNCKASISWRYPLVEFLMGFWLMKVGAQFWVYWNIGRVSHGDVNYTASQSIFYSIDVIGIAIIGFLLIGLIVMDWQTHLLPDAFTLTGIAIGLFLVCIQAIFLGPNEGEVVLNTAHQLRLSSPGSFQAQGNVFLTGPEALIYGRLLAVAGAALLLLIIRWTYRAIRKREGLGLGDVKLIAMIATFLGFWPAMLALFIGVLSATAYGLVLLVRGRAHALTRLPLGSFISAGGLIAALFGERIISSYTSMFR
jgi:leader peptidase (prepilin peptidase)/N-methyltransferase